MKRDYEKKLKKEDYEKKIMMGYTGTHKVRGFFCKYKIYFFQKEKAADEIRTNIIESISIKITCRQY